jgi:hypothetical protein
MERLLDLVSGAPFAQRERVGAQTGVNPANMSEGMLISSPLAQARPGGGWPRSGRVRQAALPPRRRLLRGIHPIDGKRGPGHSPSLVGQLSF